MDGHFTLYPPPLGLKASITKFCDGGEKLEGIPVVNITGLYSVTAITVVKTEFTGAQPGATSTEIGIQELNI